MMVQAPEEVGEEEAKIKEETEVPHIEPQTKESVPTPSNDPLPSGEDRMKLTELMNLCTNLQKQVLNLEKANTTQAKEIADLKKRVEKLERKKKSRLQERIAEIDAVENFFLIDETAQDQERMNEEELFRVNDLDGDEVIVDVTAGENVEQDATVADKEVSITASKVGTTAATTLQISKDEITLAQTLIEIKAAKLRARGVIVQELSEFRTTSSSQSSQLPQAKDKGKGIMVELEKPLKKKYQIAFDEEVARKLDAQMKAEMEEEERIAREKGEENIALIEEWDNVQATIDADKQLAEQLQAQKREQLSIKENLNYWLSSLN
nr:hypothetical protein [Tanacetum cinerariifolium]